MKISTFTVILDNEADFLFIFHVVCRYLKLIKKTDGDEYSSSMFMSARIHDFKVVLLTQLSTPPEQLLEQTYTIKIHIADPFAL